MKGIGPYIFNESIQNTHNRFELAFKWENYQLSSYVRVSQRKWQKHLRHLRTAITNHTNIRHTSKDNQISNINLNIKLIIITNLILIKKSVHKFIYILLTKNSFSIYCSLF